jgi:hypothetical protein
MQRVKRHLLIAAALTVLGVGLSPLAQTSVSGAPAQRPEAPFTVDSKITTPKQEWGHNLGDDYFLANYQQLIAYWRKLDKESDRMQVVEIGQTAMKKPQLMSIITAPANFAKLERYKEISRRLSLAEGLTDEQARTLAKEGKSVVWIDGGLHASEVLGAQQLMEFVYQMVARTDEETMRFLNDIVILAAHANPDGHDLVADAYMKHTGSTGGHPGLYNFYAGHDNNRDSYMNALPETTNMSKIMYREWFPQIAYNHHQTGPAGSVMFAPPFRDPFNYNFHPGIAAATDLIGGIMATRFIEEGKPGVVNQKGSSYSTWWNGGVRTTAYFHNQIGILTETIGSPTPGSIQFSDRFAVPEASWYWPIKPQQVWHFRQSIDYSITANRAVLDFASRYREVNLFRIYKMGADNIQWGNEDHWTITPHRLAKVRAGMAGAAPAADAAAAGGRGAGGGGGGRGGGGGGNALYTAYTSKENRDPRGFIMPSDQPDFGSAVRFVNALIKSGVAVHRATAPFTVAGKQYPANSLIVKSGQAFRPHVMDMFEPQDHPDDIAYPGATPTRPYDVAGWTLAYQMGVQFDRILDGFDGPFEKLTDFAKPPAGIIRAPEPVPSQNGAPLQISQRSMPNATESDVANARALYTRLTERVTATEQAVAGYYFSHKSNDSFIALNRLLAAGEDVSWLADGPMGTGTFYVASKPTTRAILQKAATDLGVSFQSTATAPAGQASKLRELRVGLFDTFGGGMPAGWTRLLLENFEFPFEVVYPPMLDAGGLRAKYDVLIFNDAGLLGGGGGGRGGGGGAGAGGDAPPAGGDAAGRGGAGAAGAAGGAAAAGQGRGGGRGGGGGAQAKNPADFRAPFVDYPEEFTKRRGNVSAATMEKIQQFVNEGGTVLAIGGAAQSAVQVFKLPLSNHLVKPDGTAVSGTEYYVPGSVLRVAVDPKNPLAHGYGSEADIFFDNSPVWKLDPKVGAPGVVVHPIAWFASPEPLRSGWAYGQKFLDKGIQMAEARIGQGRVFVFGNDLVFRTQPHGNYKFFFNGMYLSVAPDMK